MDKTVPNTVKQAVTMNQTHWQIRLPVSVYTAELQAFKWHLTLIKIYLNNNS